MNILKIIGNDFISFIKRIFSDFGNKVKIILAFLAFTAICLVFMQLIGLFMVRVVINPSAEFLAEHSLTSVLSTEYMGVGFIFFFLAAIVGAIVSSVVKYVASVIRRAKES